MPIDFETICAWELQAGDVILMPRVEVARVKRGPDRTVIVTTIAGYPMACPKDAPIAIERRKP